MPKGRSEKPEQKGHKKRPSRRRSAESAAAAPEAESTAEASTSSSFVTTFEASSEQAFVTLATNDEYCKGAAVVAQSLRNVGTTKKIVCLISPTVTISAKDALSRVFDELRVVDILDSNDAAHLAMLKRPELGVTFTKIHCWDLTNYSKCVFLDADTMVLQNVDELFDHDELSAVPDCGWPDIFNSGMFVFCPNKETYKGLVQLADTEGSFDGGDQGLLNTYFKNWKRLSFIYNMQATTSYTYVPAFAQFGQNTKIVHFLGNNKPWNQRGGDHLQFADKWWNAHSELPSNIRNLHISEDTSSTTQQGHYPTQYDEVSHYNQLRQGNVDYHGQDSFTKIQSKIDSQIKKKEKK